MKIMTYLDPRQTVWPGAITAACLAAILMAVGQSHAIVVTARRGMALHGVVDL